MRRAHRKRTGPGAQSAYAHRVAAWGSRPAARASIACDAPHWRSSRPPCARHWRRVCDATATPSREIARPCHACAHACCAPAWAFQKALRFVGNLCEGACDRSSEWPDHDFRSVRCADPRYDRNGRSSHAHPHGNVHVRHRLRCSASLAARLTALFRSCWNDNRRARPSASCYLGGACGWIDDPLPYTLVCPGTLASHERRALTGYLGHYRITYSPSSLIVKMKTQMNAHIVKAKASG